MKPGDTWLRKVVFVPVPQFAVVQQTKRGPQDLAWFEYERDAREFMALVAARAQRSNGKLPTLSGWAPTCPQVRQSGHAV